MRPSAFVFAFVLLAGCATPSSEILSQTASYPPTSNVEILLDPPTRAHKTFAILEDRWRGTPEEINARLADKGKEIGADAVVITNINDKAVTEWILTDPYYYGSRYIGPRFRPVTHVYRSVRAKAIKYLGSP